MRYYSIPFTSVTISAIQDLVGVLSAAGKYAEVVRVWVADVDLTIVTGLELQVTVNWLGATVTAGTGGTSTAPAKCDQGDAAAQSTAWQNATTIATTTGSTVILYPNGCEIRQGLDWMLPQPVPFQNGEAVVFRLAAAPNATVKLSGGMLIAERGT